MFIIPVIDLLNGRVVHAKHGDRANYQPIQSPLCSSSDPLAVANALLTHYPCDHLYIADLNAIQKLTGHHLDMIQQIARQHPHVSIWVDAGIANLQDLNMWSDHHFNLILGSENFSSLDNFLAVSSKLNKQFVLSLDFMPQGYQGPPALIENPQYWPDRVIVMALSKVGSSSGLEVALLEQFKVYTAQFEIFAAGGVRNLDDLKFLKKIGMQGALVASALHQQAIQPDEIQL